MSRPACVYTVEGVTVALTDHFIQRYWQRVGRLEPAGQAAWVARSIARGRARRYSGGIYITKLRGSSHELVLSRDGRVWVAITVK